MKNREKVNSWYKRGLVIASAVAGSLGIVALPSAQVEAQAQGFECSPVHIVDIGGTGASYIGKDNAMNANEKGNITEQMIHKFGGKVTGWSTDYPASAGAAYSASSPYGQTYTFGASRLYGDRRTIEHMEEYKAQCGDNVKFIITGYSQGASVAGDVGALIAHDVSDTVKPDDIGGVVLFADPERSGNSPQYTGVADERQAYIPLPDGAEFQRGGEYSSAGQYKETVGWTGQRSLGFEGLEGKVISLCNPIDMACSVSPDSILRRVADLSDKNFRPVPESYKNNVGLMPMFTKGRLGSIISQASSQGVVKNLLDGKVVPAINTLEKIVETDQSINNDERDTLKNAIAEIKYIWGLLKSEDGYGPQASDADILRHVIQSAGPGLVDTIPDQMVNDQTKPFISAFLSMYGKGSITTIDQATQDKMKSAIQHAGKFSNEHAQYFSDERKDIQIGGQSQAAWATGAIETGINNILNNTPYAVSPGNAPREAGSKAEVHDPDRAPDGLLWMLDSSWNGDEGRLNPDGTPKDGIIWDDTPGDQSGNDNSGDGSSDDGSGEVTSAPHTVNQPSDIDSTTSTSVKKRSTDKSSESSSAKSASESRRTNSSTTSTPTSSSAPVSAQPVGASVNTGGNVEDSIFSRLSLIFQ